MVIIITGASHTGKTLAAQKLLERYKYPYFSIDLMKMGLIRSGNTSLTPTDPDEKLTPYLWGIVKEVIKTAIENRQDLIVEGCYVPFDWKKDFTHEYLREIRYFCLVMTERYIRAHCGDIIAHESDIEKRLPWDFAMEEALAENARYLSGCKENGLLPLLIDERYEVEINLQG